jgi:hypothetical protein
MHKGVAPVLAGVLPSHEHGGILVGSRTSTVHHLALHTSGTPHNMEIQTETIPPRAVA